MKLLALGDLHVFSLWPGLTGMLSKRLAGQTNLWLNRRKVFQHQWLPGILDRMQSVGADAVLLTGDFTTTSLRAEFRRARGALESLEDIGPVYAVTGNHDRYTFASARNRVAESWLGDWLPRTTPHLKPLGGAWKLLRIDTAIPNAFASSGRVGPDQMRRVAETLKPMTDADGLVVMTHYPVVLPESVHQAPSHALQDKAELAALLADCPAQVMHLHGHIHKPWVYPPAEGAAFLSVDVGAPCYVSEAYPAGQGFVEIELPEGANQGQTPRIWHHLPSFSTDSNETETRGLHWSRDEVL